MAKNGSVGATGQSPPPPPHHPQRQMCHSHLVRANNEKCKFSFCWRVKFRRIFHLNRNESSQVPPGGLYVDQVPPVGLVGLKAIDGQSFDAAKFRRLKVGCAHCTRNGAAHLHKFAWQSWGGMLEVGMNEIPADGWRGDKKNWNVVCVVCRPGGPGTPHERRSDASPRRRIIQMTSSLIHPTEFDWKRLAADLLNKFPSTSTVGTQRVSRRHSDTFTPSGQMLPSWEQFRPEYFHYQNASRRSLVRAISSSSNCSI